MDARYYRYVCFILLLGLSGCTVEYEYTVYGTVVTSDAKPIEGVLVQLETHLHSYEVKTDQEGQFRFTTVFYAPDYDTGRTQSTLKVTHTGKTVTLDVTTAQRPSTTKDGVKVLVWMVEEIR